MRNLSCLFAVAVLAACPSSTPSTTTTSAPTETPPTTTGPTTPSTEQPAGPGRGEPCGADDACAPGLGCVRYYGIAGPRGPEFRSCESRCSPTGGCPDGTTCITIADGPGQVCRKSEPTTPASTDKPAAPGRGETCGANDACAPGLECVKYRGIAGARGPEFKSCETRCRDGKGCPDGTKCITIADGPGQVCR